MKNANCWFLGLVTWLLFYISLNKFAVVRAAEEQAVTVNTVKWAQIISDRFLSITIDPETLLLGKDTFSDTTRILKLARGLAPSYLRIGGPSINRYYFGSILSGDKILNNTRLTESQWVMFNDFAREAGFDVIVCLNALQRLDGIWDPRNALELISFSDKMGYKIDWELGYELQKLDGTISAEQLAMDVNRLRNILNSFSHYKHSIIVGPDITNLYTKKDIDFLREFMQEAGSSLDAITWHPKYLSSSSYPTTGEELDYMLERLIFEKEGLTKVLGRHITRKPIWIAESDNDTSHGHFIDALNWAQELGSFAGIGIQTVMRQPNLQVLFEITPSYWVSLLHKALVGPVVLDVRHNSASNTNIPVFCHCTNSMKNSKASELITTFNKYEPGAITFFAVNRRSSEIILSVKLSSGMKQDAELHQYILSGDHTMGDPLLSRNTLLNGKRLSLEHTGELPELSPHIKHIGWNLTVSLPPASIGFWVIPRASVKLCVSISKKAAPHRTDIQSQPLVKAVAVGSYVSSHGSRNLEVLSKDLKHGVNAGTSKNETFRDYLVDESKSRAFKNKKHHSLKNKRFLEKKTQEFKYLATADENEASSLHVSNKTGAYIDNNNDQLSKTIVEELRLESQGNYTANISNEQKSVGRFKRYAPENNNAISFSGIPVDIYPQSSLSGRPPKTRRKKKAELKSDKKEEREQRKDKLKQKDDNIQATLFDPFFSSMENEEQYFHNMKREDNEIQSFPSGDIYLKQGDSSEERRNKDYDYVDRDEKEFKEDEDEVDDDMETADIDLSLKPGEFFETIRGTKDKINEHFVGYGGELWEAETFTLTTPAEKMEDIADDEGAYDQDVIHESAPTEEEDRKRKAAAAKLLNSYLTEGYAEKNSEEGKHKDKASKKTRIQRKTERKQEYAQDYDDDYYFITDHKDKTKKTPERPTHPYHHHHHHHVIGHSKSAKEGKQNHYDHAHNIHNHKDKTRKLTNHNEKHLFSEEDDIFFPHISHEKDRGYKRNHNYHRNLHSSEEKIEPMKNPYKGREKAAQSSQIKNDPLILNDEHSEGSSTSTKSSRQSRARKVNHRIDEGSDTNSKSKNDIKTSENENDNNLSRMYEESSENRKETHRNDRQQKNKTNKSSISASSSNHTHKDKDIHNEKKKSKDKQKHFSSGDNNKYETKDLNSEALDSRSIESNTKVYKKNVQVMQLKNSFEEDESQMNSGEIIEEENEHELDANSAEYTDKRTTLINPVKPNHKAVIRSSSENEEDVKVKSQKHKEKNTNHKIESIKVNSSAISPNNNEKVGHRKSKKIENTSEDSSINNHMSRNGMSPRKPSQTNDYSNEESTEKTELASRPSVKTQDSKHKSEKGKKSKQRSQEISVEQENDSTHTTEDSLELSNKRETRSDAHENLSLASSEIETKIEPLSNEDLSSEDISDQHSRNMQSQQKSLKVSRSKYKNKAKHISEEHILEDNISDIPGELKKRHTSAEHHTEANKESELSSEGDKLEGESKQSGEVESRKEKPRTPSDENNEKPSKEKDTKQKNGKHKTTKKNDHHNRARREIFALLTKDDNNNTSVNHNYGSENPNKEMPSNSKPELFSDIDLGLGQNEMQHLIDSANTFIGNIVADDNDVNLEPIMFLAPQQYVENEEYLPQDVLGHKSSLEDIILEDIAQENTQSSKIAEYNPYNEHSSGSESHTGTWTFRSDNSIEIFNEKDAEPLIRENNAKREVDSKAFANAVVQPVWNKRDDNKEQILYKSSPYLESMNSNQDKQNVMMIRGVEENNRHVQFQSPVDAGEIYNTGNETTYIQDNYSTESNRNRKYTSNEKKEFDLLESSLKVNHDMPIKPSDDGFARNTLISKESDFQNLFEKNINEELSKEELLYSKEKSDELDQLSLDLNSGINQHIGKNKPEDISVKSVVASEYVERSPIDFNMTDSTISLYSESQQNPEPLTKMFAAGPEKEELYGDKTSEEHDYNKDNNEPIESKYHMNIHEDTQFERIPKAIMHVIENTSDMDKIEPNNEGDRMLNPAEETRNSNSGLEMESTVENTGKYNISSKELTNSELLEGTNTTSYDQKHTARDANNGEPVSLSSLSPETNLDNNDASTKVSLASINDEARNSEPTGMNTNVSKEVAPSERSSSVSDFKKIKTGKPLTLPRKNTDRLKLEQKYKERIQQLKARRAKIKAGLFKKPDANQFRKADNISTNKKIRKRRAIGEEAADHKSSLQQLINDENLSQQMIAPIVDSSSDSQDEKSLSEHAPVWVTKDSDSEESSEEQPYKFIKKVQHTTPHLWNTDILVTPSHIVTESIGIFDPYTPRTLEQRSTEISDTVSVPVTLHKTLLITENNPYYADEEAVRGENEQDATNSEFISEEVFVKLTAPLINYEPFNNLQQGTTYFHKFIPVHENDIDILKGTYSDDFESGNIEVKEVLDTDRSPRYVSSIMQGDPNFKNNFQSGYFAEPTDIKGYSNDKIIILKHPLHKHDQYKMDLSTELNASPNNLQDGLENYETNSDRFIEDISSKAGRDTRREAVFTSGTNDIDTHLLFPNLEVITDMQTSNNNNDALVNEDTSDEDQMIFAVRSKRDLRTDYDPLNDDLLLPFFIPIIPENEKSLDSFLDKIDSQQFKEINNEIDSLQVVSAESDMKKEIMNEHQTMNVNERSLTPQSILGNLLNLKSADNKILGSNYMNQINVVTDDANADASLKKRNLFNVLHPNSLNAHILDFGKKQAGYKNNRNGLNVIVSDETFNEGHKPLYKNADEYVIPINSKERIKYLYPFVSNHNPAKKIIEEYAHTKKSNPNIFLADAESHTVLKDKKMTENNSSEYDGEAISKEVLDVKKNLLNESHSKHYAYPKEEHSVTSSLYLENSINNDFNTTNSFNFENEPGNHTENTLRLKEEDAVTTEEDSVVYNKSARASTKGKHENQKTAADSRLSTFHGILRTLTESVIGFLHQLSPWKTSAD